MSCNKPLIAFQRWEKNGAGKRPISFSPSGDTNPIALPCGQCMGCRVDRARSWAIRLHLETMQHKESCFVTLTYDQEYIPYGDTLVPEDLSRFIKRLRKYLGSHRIRFYGVGEYGGITQRPHYHAIIYGYDFPDRVVHIDRSDYTIDNSAILSRLWPLGHATVQSNSVEACAYVSKYAVKKITGEKAKDYYLRVDEQTGEILKIEPEFARMSRRPGIGFEWLRKYHSDIFPKGYVTNGKGIKIPPPEYFNKLYEKWFPEQWEKIRDERSEEVFERYNEFNEERAMAREAIQKSRFKTYKGGKI